jgi:hypothetical protein
MGIYGPDGANNSEFQGTGLCSACGFQNEEGSFACLHCDHILDETNVTVCSKCGFENASDLVQCLNCGHALGEADGPEATRVDSVEVFSTWRANVAQSVRDQLQAAGVTSEILDSEGSVTLAAATFAVEGEGTRTGSLFIVVPADQASQAEAVIKQIDVNDAAPPVDQAPEAANENVCPECETPYDLDDYDPQALRIYCSTCRSELPRHGTTRFGTKGGLNPSNPG